MARTPDPTIKIALLRASEQVFAAHGLANAKVEEITQRAGTSKGAFYLHFDSKEEAFKQVAESFLARLSAAFPTPDAMDVPGNPAGALALWLQTDEAIYEFLWRNRAIVTILQGCQGGHVYLLEAFQRETHQRIKEWVAHWKAVGMFRPDLDDDLAATLMGGAHDALARKMIGAREKPPLSRVLREAQAAFARAFGTKELIGGLGEIENAPVSRAIQRTVGVRPSAVRRGAKASG